MARLLNHPVLNAYVKKLLSEHCIVYAYQSSSLFPGSGNYGSRIHVDCPRFIEGYVSNIGVIFPLDDFTEENGATFYLPKSHLRQNLPNEDEFYKNAQRILARKGDMVVFNARLVHAAGENRTDKVRHSLTINLCRPYMRQRFDFARMVPRQTLDILNDDGKRMIGMNVRMPASLEEFYRPPDQRLYKPGQE
jgi:ectoine hydroxylase-related dioxygenase (phytanoyl-CoA dioxygenase family)